MISRGGVHLEIQPIDIDMRCLPHKLTQLTLLTRHDSSDLFSTQRHVGDWAHDFDLEQFCYIWQHIVVFFGIQHLLYSITQFTVTNLSCFVESDLSKETSFFRKKIELEG